MYLAKTPQIVRNLFPNLIWTIPGESKEVFLTFDDGPIPEATPWVLDQLKAYQAKATFFCVGENVERHPEIYQQILEDGHTVGSHTHNHLSGWGTENIHYLKNIATAASVIESKLFRPPYGRIKPSQWQAISKRYDIVMWDVLSGDFDANISKEQCLQNVVTNYENGSIVVFHDSLKTIDKLHYVLPRVLDHLSEKGYTLNAIGQKQIQRTSAHLRKSA